MFGPQADSFFTTRDYLGQKIVTFKSPGAQDPAKTKAVHYTVVKGYWIVGVGSPSGVETALQTIAGDQPTLWQKVDVQMAFNQLPPTASAFQYDNIQALLGVVFRTLSSTASLMGPASSAPEKTEDSEKEEGDEAPKLIAHSGGAFVDPSAEPDAETLAKYWNYSWGYVLRESSGIHITSQIVYPK